MTEVVIRPYDDADERGWVECRVLAFLDSAYYDAVEREKEHYERPSIELVAEVDGTIVGLIDVELEEEPGTVCEDRPGLGGMIWHLAVLRDFRRQGIASRLLAAAEECRASARNRAVRGLDERRRVGAAVVRVAGLRADQVLPPRLRSREERDRRRDRLEFPDLKPVHVFAHYSGDERDECAAASSASTTASVTSAASLSLS